MLSVTDFDPKGIISGVRVQAGLYLDMLDADRSPNAVSVHAGTSQVDFEIDRPPPAPPGHLLITMVKEAVFVQKMSFEKWKKVVSLIDLKVMKTRNDCEIACDCVKRANVVLHVGLWKEIIARKHTATHKPTSIDICSAPLQLPAWHLIIVWGAPRAYGLAGQQDRWSLGAPQASYERRRHRNCFQTGPVQAFPKK